jgi:hypothetical protein
MDFWSGSGCAIRARAALGTGVPLWLRYEIWYREHQDSTGAAALLFKRAWRNRAFRFSANTCGNGASLDQPQYCLLANSHCTADVHDLNLPLPYPKPDRCFFETQSISRLSCR